MSHQASSSSSATVVAYQGEPGAYSECAAYELLGEGVDARGYSSFEDAFKATESGAADLALLPVENSLGGSIYRNFDLLLRYDLSVVAEYNFRVRHCLMVLPETSKEDVKVVYSHPQALAQCDEYIRDWGVGREATYDTAGSAKMIAEGKLEDAAAIASSLAAQHYGLTILDHGIEDESGNVTRFLLLRREAVHPPSGIPSKTSLTFVLRQNVPGALFKAISCFSLREIDLSKVESRPDKKIGKITNEERSASSSSSSSSAAAASSSSSALMKASWSGTNRRVFNYRFFLDFLGNRHDQSCVYALRHLAEVTSSVRILGCYPQNGRLVSSILFRLINYLYLCLRERL